MEAFLTQPFPVTLVGSMPGDDVREAVGIIAGELPDLPFQPEFPARGPGSDMLGRTLSLLCAASTEFAATTTPTGWRLAPTLSGSIPRLMRVGQSWVSEDLDAVEEAFAGFDGQFKIAMAGPFTLAAAVELASGEPALADAGALRAFVDVTVAATADLVAQVRRRLPGARLVVQYDEPLLDQVLSGRIKSQSGVNSIWVPRTTVAALLDQLAGERPEHVAALTVHSCASAPPVAELVAAGFDAVSIDFTRLVLLPEHDRRVVETGLATYVEDGGTLFVGLNAGRDRLTNRVGPLAEFLDRTGLVAGERPTQFALTERCGLADAPSLKAVRTVIDNLKDVQRAMSGQDVAGSGDR